MDLIFFCLRFNLSNDNIIFPNGQVWKRVWILVVGSENGCGKWHFLVWSRVRIRRNRRHTPTKNFQEYPPPRTSVTYSVLNFSLGFGIHNYWWLLWATSGMELYGELVDRECQDWGLDKSPEATKPSSSLMCLLLPWHRCCTGQKQWDVGVWQ